jgi:hypothetical protein
MTSWEAGSAMSDTGWYVYGVIGAGHTSIAEPPYGIGGTRTELVTEGDLAALAAPIDLAELHTAPTDPRGDGRRADAERAHDRVIEGTFARVQVFPLRFGTVCASRAEVARLLRDREAEFVEGLQRVADAAEWSVRLVAGPTEPAAVAASRVTRSDDPTAWPVRRHAAARARTARRMRWGRAAAELHNQLTPIVRDVVLAARTRVTPMHMVYLVARDDEDAFVTALWCARVSHVDPDLRMSVSGPRAAYHFTGEPRDDLHEASEV